jgi:Xaa-Pro aminopeptidase
MTTGGEMFYNAFALARINGILREVKTDEEIALLRKAVDLTCRGFHEAMKSAEPGMHEYELENINEFVWKKEGAEHAGYPSIVGGGHNSCVLHYETNRKKLLAGDLVVMDMGAEYHGYTADVTRTFPVNGRFTPEQKTIYELVLQAQEAGLSACVPGNAFSEPHRAALDVIAQGLVRLGIIREASEATRYFMHGTSHYLGLDVHDPGSYGPLKPNSVITVEPGIYIKEGSPCDRKWWNIGVRIEDDVLITPGGHENLSDCVPKDVAEIEALMARESPFNRVE